MKAKLPRRAGSEARKRRTAPGPTPGAPPGSAPTPEQMKDAIRRLVTSPDVKHVWVRLHPRKGSP